ncbi:hypothetical protein AJ79_03524 [Helicocarpus griseus UAMH5409]|uniref:Uncharacterized protein n=1 Tax=Helicocarpus griseus UAMH5409 TaxID=1447875 RepID=A0A2B7XXK6_9EURO|nr:hypothetical protein AJ79_03524 [Helicocarpus griseus UAMH5409]
MPPTITLIVSIYDNPGIKHWNLFIDAPGEADKTTIQLLGARQRYFRDVRTPSDARALDSLIEACNLCEIDASMIEAVKNIAWDTPVRNEEADYSCQDFVLDVLERLEAEGIINGENGDYKRNKEIVKTKRESWQ